MRIPKIIHYVWVGNNEIGYLERKCLESWKKYLPDFKIILWNENNIPKNIDYLDNAWNHKKWSNISNYVRLHALKEFGGLYFDTDFEVIKKFDFLDNVNCFIGFESESQFVNNAIMGSVKNHHFINDCLTELVNNFDGTEKANLSSPILATKVLKSYGELHIESFQLNDVNIFTREYFSPFNPDSVFLHSDLKINTYGIHHWSKSWILDEVNQKYDEISIKYYKILKGNFTWKFIIKILINKIFCVFRAK